MVVVALGSGGWWRRVLRKNTRVGGFVGVQTFAGGVKLHAAVLIVDVAGSATLHVAEPLTCGSFHELANTGSPTSKEALESYHETSRTLLISKP